jgi:tetratricopeptide (TPR) repeat protein
MTKAPISSTLPKSKGGLIEYILLGFCLCIIALRTTFTESPGTPSPSLPVNLGDAVYSLSVSAVLILACVLWFAWSCCSKRFSYRITGIEAGLCLLCAASIIAGFTASDKRLSINNVIMLLAPLLMVILLVQILDSPTKINLVLCVIGALGVVSACESVYQLLVTNQATIEQYEQAPQTLLEPLGIEPGTFQHFLFEHRLYTKGIHGFFTTRNSAGCFALMATFAAVILLIDKLKSREDKQPTIKRKKPPVKLGIKYLNPYFLTSGAALIIIIIGLILTKSKGAIIGSLFAAVLFIAYLYLGNRLKPHKKIIIIACLLLVILCGWLVISYGLKHNRLPGGSGMLVRWQYWHASAKMYADHLLTGVGPGNFKNFYSHYKPAEALESVADPHNFLLNILTQYGPIGLAGFIALILIPLWKATSVSSIEHRVSSIKPSSGPKTHWGEPAFRTLAIIFLIVISAALLLIRPMILAETPADTLELKVFVISTIYIAPVLAFIIGFLLLSAPLSEKSKTCGKLVESIESRKSKIPIAILWCAVLGVLLNNLIDYAIFEPGVYTTFWAIVACTIAMDLQRNSRQKIILKSNIFTKIIAVTATIVIIIVYVGFLWWPVYKSTTKIKQAYQALSTGRFSQAHEFLTAAAEEDRLDATALNLNGRLYLQHYSDKGEQQQTLLKKAEKNFLEAINRNKADYKNYEKLSDVYELLGQTQKAYDWCFKAIQLYPNSGRLRFKSAKIAEQLSKVDIAIEQYKKAIEIEDSFRQQFKMMYPERKEIVSRLGKEKYHFAIKRLKELIEKNSL